MNTRYKITRNQDDPQSDQQISLEESLAFFATQDDFSYTEHYSVHSNGTVMTIKGHFFMWQMGEAMVPFRYFEGDVYVAISHELIYRKMEEVAEGLRAFFIEG